MCAYRPFQSQSVPSTINGIRVQKHRNLDQKGQIQLHFKNETRANGGTNSRGA